MPRVLADSRNGWEASAPSDPPPGDAPSQGAALTADQVSVPDPVFVTLIAATDGFPWSDAAEKLIVLGLVPILGRALTFSVTFTNWGVLEAPIAARWTAARYVPSARPRVFTETVKAFAPTDWFNTCVRPLVKTSQPLLLVAVA